MRTPNLPTAGVRRVLRKLGADIRDARRRRRLPMAVVAERAFTSRSTLRRVEQGDPAVGIGIYAGVLQALCLLEALGDIADPANDTVGQAHATATCRDVPGGGGLRSCARSTLMPDVEISNDLAGQTSPNARFPCHLATQ